MFLSRTVAWLLPFLALVAVAPVSANEGNGTLSPYFFIEGGDPRTDRLPLLGTDVTAEIAGVIASVTVRQIYKNDGTRPIHARYVFPASTRAAVHGLTMKIGDRIITARIQEREEASRAFQEAKRSGRNASLLEQERPNVFTMHVANLVPGQRIEVELRYSELLVPSEGVYEFVYPTVVGPRYSRVPDSEAATHDRWLRTPYTRQTQPPRYSLALTGTVTAGVPVRDVFSPSHAIRTQPADPSGIDFSLVEEEGGDRDFVLRYRLAGDALQSGLMLYDGPGEDFFLTMIQPPRRVRIAEIPLREYVFVIDVSGSMNGFPLNTAKKLVRDLVGHLRPADSFNVLLFSGGSRLWSARSLPATEANTAAAIAMIDQEQGGGGTELLAALQRAMALPPGEGPRSRTLIVITDGYVAAEREIFGYIRSHLGRANLFVFGIGSSVNRHLIEGMARAGMGEPFVVLRPEEASDTAARFRSYVQSPLLTDVRVAFQGFDTYDVEPAALPDVMAERPVVLYGKWRGQPAGHVVVTGRGGSGPFEQVVEVRDVEPAASNHALRSLWARARLADLSDAAGRQETAEEKRNIVQLGLTYNLLTRHTSFVAVHERIVNESGVAEEVAQPLPLPQGVTDYAIGMGVGAEPALAWLCLPLLVVGLCLALLRWSTRAEA